MYIFTPNTLIRSSEINANFDELNDKIGGNGTSYAWLNNVLIQLGSFTCAQGGTGTSVTYPIAYTSTPVVQLTVTDPGNFYTTVRTNNTTAFYAIHSYGAGPLALFWLAVGIKTGKPS